MFAVVYKNKVILAPVSWNSSFIEASLRRKDLRVVVPRREPRKFPFDLTDEVKVVRAVHNKPDINPRTHYYHGPHWDLSNPDVAVANYNPQESPMEAVKENYKAFAASERYRRANTSIDHTLDGLKVKIDTGFESRNVFLSKFVTMGPKDTANWKFSEGWASLSRNDIKDILSAIDSYVQKMFDWEMEIVEAIEKAQTIEEILAIQIVDKKRDSTSLRDRALRMKESLGK